LSTERLPLVNPLRAFKDMGRRGSAMEAAGEPGRRQSAAGNPRRDTGHRQAPEEKTPARKISAPVYPCRREPPPGDLPARPLPAARRKGLAVSGARSGVPEGGAAAVPTHGITETAP